MGEAHSTMKVLIIDGNVGNLAFAAAALEDEDIAVSAVENVSEALRVLAAAPHDCVVLDVRLSGMDGFSACRAIRDMPGGHSLPVVFLTAARSAENFDRAIEAGADDFITKPVLANELVARVRAAVHTKELSDGMRTLHDVLCQHCSELSRMRQPPRSAVDFTASPDRATLEQLSEQADKMLRLVDRVSGLSG